MGHSGVTAYFEMLYSIYSVLFGYLSAACKTGFRKYLQ